MSSEADPERQHSLLLDDSEEDAECPGDGFTGPCFTSDLIRNIEKNKRLSYINAYFFEGTNHHRIPQPRYISIGKNCIP